MGGFGKSGPPTKTEQANVVIKSAVNAMDNLFIFYLLAGIERELL
jgi:hypothetical protein